LARSDNPADDAEDSRASERDVRKPRTQISIDEVREASEFLQISSHRGVARIVLIHPAHALTTAAANALLKVLEEPPAGSLFLLVTSQPARLLATVRSRCTKLALAKPSRTEAVGWLESTGMTNPELALAQVGGAPYAAAELGERYWTVRSALLPYLSGIEQDWLRASATLIDVDLPHVVQVLQTWCWDLLSARFRGDVRYHPDRSIDIGRAASRMKGIELADFVRKLAESRRLLGHPLNARLFMEDLLMSYKSLMQVHEHS